MSSRRRIAMATYAGSVLLVLLGLVWITYAALRLERQAREDSALNGRVLVALWRMESTLSPIIARQSGWRYYHYLPFYPAERAYTRMFEEVRPGEVLVPSPLLLGPGEHALLHFQIGPENRLSSPQVPEGNMRDLAESTYVPSARIVEAETTLDALAEVLGARKARTWTLGGASIRELIDVEPAAPQSDEMALKTDDYISRSLAAGQARRGQVTSQTFETPQRRNDPATPAEQRTRETDTLMDRAVGGAAAADALIPQPQERIEGELSPVWRTGPSDRGPALLFVRSVHVAGEDIVQGVWVDWPRLREHLLESVRDLLPEASLHPVYPGTTPASTGGAGHLLASVPAVLVPGPIRVEPGPVVTPARLALGGTWLAALAAIAAVGGLLRASMELAERRGRFVSAVTHELRTPLTTFRLYSEMLADNLVRDESARAEYLGTLKREARRLSGIVENVLEYARLGERRRPGVPGALAVSEVVSRVAGVLRERAERGGMELVVREGASPRARVLADEATIERILLNLVDNACKYAGGAKDRRLLLDVREHGAMVAFTLRDFGPGVPMRDRTRIFDAFHRSVRDANGPCDGLGLGLALARGLARELGGDLTYATPDVGGGAEFTLTLPGG